MGLLSAYKGLKHILGYSYMLGDKSLLSAYKGLKPIPYFIPVLSYFPVY